ncbi:HNH endonuclease [Anaeromyxobacter dehalogenans]|uniref:HNH endonuclease n=1 Tax=Anaeromyxobacter dehalogenans TaxID=161493 RepID=UPI001FE0492E|nr:HNH endonuclease signature motif containing protein [Anaeromyxobacter dehalogenans]
MDAAARQPPGPPPPGLDLQALSAQAWALELPTPRERRSVLRHDAAELIDGLLVRVARGQGALDVAIGDGLAALSRGPGPLALGFSSVGDYARERLGIAPSTAQKLAGLSRGLRDRPLLREAVWRGEVSPRKAQTILKVARGADEAAWVARARTETVRALAAAARGAGAGGPEEPERLLRIDLPLTPRGRPWFDQALALAGRMLGASAPRWARVEIMCQEFLSSHPEPLGPDGRVQGADEAEEDWPGGARSEWLAAAMEALEAETARWSYLEVLDPVAAPPSPDEDGADPNVLDARLRALAGQRDRWDALLGHLGLLMMSLRLWREAGFASFSHYCAERLGMSARAVEQRAALERRLYELPALREAMAAGRISYEKARVIAAAADADTVHDWIARAGSTPCVALRREADAREDARAQMCARGDLPVRMPRRVLSLLEAVIRAARDAAGTRLDDEICLEWMALHFLQTWLDAVPPPRTRHQRVLERDGGLCTMPGCSRSAVHAHHLQLRSRGGSDDPSNLTSLCLAHHLGGVHGGFIELSGTAPQGLRVRLTS